MEIQQYFARKKDIYKALLDYIEGNLKEIANFFTSKKISDNPNELVEVFLLIVKISENHFRDSMFIQRIEEILIILFKSINQIFSNSQIFNFVKFNKYILYILLKNQIIVLDNSIFNQLINQDNYFYYFFYPEIQSFLSESTINAIKKELLEENHDIFNDFEEKRRIGENDFYICNLIRNDTINEFIKYVNQTNYELSSLIKSSIFETNPILMNKTTTLIEYSAFFGSIQIFQFLITNNVELTSSLGFYAIHGKCAEIIHLLEENKIDLNDETYNMCLKESIKCHHNDIASYFLNNFIETKEDDEKPFYDNWVSYCFEYFNYEMMPTSLNYQILFYYSCKHNYLELVKLLMKQNVLDKKADIISSCIYMRFYIVYAFILLKLLIFM